MKCVVVGLGLGLALAGCLQVDLVPCGSVLCPSSSRCVAGACVDPMQLDACERAADGDACIVFDAAGTCRDGVCQVVRCGNGVLDPGELCDDGNVESGDGCRFDCASDETCGNGVRDPGENCDCGRDDATLREGCPTPNDDATTALCDTRCQRTCGDGQVTGLEACDGTNVPATCGDFGYYVGQVTCTPFCTYAQQCSGRCGDGVVQATYGELCDGGAPMPPDDSCVGFGRDYGVLGCNAFCNPDVGGDCSFYGMRRLASVAAGFTIQAAQANAHGWAILDQTGALTVSYDRSVTTVPQGAVGNLRLYATADAFVTIDALGAIVRYDATAPTTLSPSWPPALTAKVIADASALYQLDTATCGLKRLDVATGAEATVSSPPLPACQSFDVIDGRIVVTSGSELSTFAAGSWTTPTAIPGTNVAWYGFDAVAVDYYDPFDDVVVDRVVDLQSGAILRARELLGNLYVKRVTTRDGNAFEIYYMEDENALLGFASDVAVTVPGVLIPAGIERGGDGRVVVRSPSELFELRAAWAPPVVGSGWTLQGDGTLVLYADTYIKRDRITVAWNATLNGTPTSVAGDPRGVHRVASTLGIYRFDPVTRTYANELSGDADLYPTRAEIWADVSGTTYRLESGTWVAHPLPSGCSLIDADSAPVGFAVLANCAGSHVVLRWAANTWNSLAQPLSSAQTIVVASNGALVAANGADFAAYDGATWTRVTRPHQPRSIAARSATDVHLQGDGPIFEHWNGATFEPFRPFSGQLMVTTAARAIPGGLLVTTTIGSSALAWWGDRPTGL